MNRPSLDIANHARARANAERGSALAGLRAGSSDVPSIVRSACLPDGEALRKIPLVRLLSGQVGWSKRQARATLRSTLKILEIPSTDEHAIDRLTIMWLIDARAGGRRMRALADAIDPKEQSPWRGFPYSVPAKEDRQMTGNKVNG